MSESADAIFGPAHARYLWGQSIGGGVFNAVLNGAIAWWAFGHKPPQPLWARGPCVATDAIGTGFFLPLLACVILTFIVRRDVRGGRAPALARSTSWIAQRAPRNVIARGALMGIVCAPTTGVASALVLQALGIDPVSGLRETIFKAVYTFVLAAVVSPVIALVALADPPKLRAARA